MTTQFLRLATLLVGITLAAGVQANSCKSLDQPVCESNSQCTWVQGYERSDGRKVASYCRNAPSKRGTPRNAGFDMSGDRQG